MTADPLPIVPLAAPPFVAVQIPGSKSITNRALVCAALATGDSVLRGALRSDDTDAMVEGLRQLGAHITAGSVHGGADDLTITGTAGQIAQRPATVRARLSGTTSRFLLPVAALGSAPIVIDGEGPLRARPVADLLDALTALGVTVASDDGRLPATVTGPVPPSAVVDVEGSASSQFLSALLLVAPCCAGGLRIRVRGHLQSSPYVEMTLAVMRAFGAEVAVSAAFDDFDVAATGYQGAEFDIEPDASAASYFFAAAALTGGSITVDGLGSESLQGDVRFVDVLERCGAAVERNPRSLTVTGTGRLLGGHFDFAEISDTAQTLAAIAPYAEEPTVIDGIGFIRRKETDRIGAMVTELRRCGIEATELPDGLRVEPGTPSPAVIETYHDHRMAMSFAILGLRASGISIADPACVAKTFPQFWSVLETLRAGMSPLKIIAIDGPAGSGKSTIAALVAQRLGLDMLDTGAMYRAITCAVLRSGGDPDDAASVSSLAAAAEISVTANLVTIDGSDVTTEIRGPEVSAAVSQVAVHSGVRSRLRRLQQDWMQLHGGGVVEGRDIGTVVFPEAPVKVFLTASPEVRARRRAGDGVLDESTAASNIAARDEMDSTREDSPLVAASDAVVIDTSDLGIDEVVERIVEVAMVAIDWEGTP